MQLVTKKDKNAHSVNFSLLLKYGSINDKRHKGIAHMIEHLCFRRAGEYTQSEIYRFCEQRGVKINAKTGKNYICFNFVCLPKYFSDILVVFYKMFSGINYTEEDLFLEKKVIINEINISQQTNGQIIINEMWADKHYSEEILGNVESVKEITLVDIKKHKKNMFLAPASCFLFGNFVDDDVNLIKNLFSDLKDENIELITDKESSKNFGNKIKFIKDDYDTCDVYYAFKLGFFNSNRETIIICLQMLNSALFQGDAGYIIEKLREEFGVLYEINTRIEFNENEAVLLCHFTVNNDELCNTIIEFEKLLRNFELTTELQSYLLAFFCDNIELLYDNLNNYAEQWIENYIDFNKIMSPEEKAIRIKQLPLSTYKSVYMNLLKTKQVYCFGNISSKQRKIIRNNVLI